MLPSLYAGVSGLRADQQMMDVVGNNIANINTTGFKASRVTFSDTLSQLLSGASAANAQRGSVNAQQIGLGVKVGAIDTVTTQGSIQTTGRLGDLAIQGEGYFAARSGQQMLFTRAGALNFDQNGNLVTSNGSIVQGWMANPATGAINTSTPVSDIAIGVGRAYPPSATTSVTVGGNLSNGAAVGDVVSTSISVVDSLGTSHDIEIDYTNTGPNAWTQTVKDPTGAVLGTTALTFNPSTGALATPVAPPSFTYTPTSGANPVTFTTGYGTPGQADALTQFGGSTTAAATGQNGVTTGYLSSVSFGDDGTITGVFSNGKSMALGQVATATFANPGGLTKSGDSMFNVSNSSGAPTFGVPGSSGHGSLAVGALEMSNVDLSQEFTQLIVAQRGFQATSKVITTSDQMLQDLVNLKQ